MIDLLLKTGVETLLVVFDGMALPSKKDTNDKRAAKRMCSLQKAIDAEAAGDAHSAQKHYQSSISISPQMMQKVITVLRQRGIRFMVAPYEADAQLAQLSMSGQVDLVVTEDSDALPYGCQRVLYKLGKDGYGELIEAADLTRNVPLSFANWNNEQFKIFCCLSGCDYFPRIKSLGIKTAYKIVATYRTLPRILSHLLQAFEPSLVTEAACSELARAVLTMKHQVVYDAEAHGMCHLQPLPPVSSLLHTYLLPCTASSNSVSGSTAQDGDGRNGLDVSFLGDILDGVTSARLVSGFLNPRTLQPFSEAGQAGEAGTETWTGTGMEPDMMVDIPHSNSLYQWYARGRNNVGVGVGNLGVGAHGTHPQHGGPATAADTRSGGVTSTQWLTADDLPYQGNHTGVSTAAFHGTTSVASPGGAGGRGKGRAVGNSSGRFVSAAVTITAAHSHRVNHHLQSNEQQAFGDQHTDGDGHSQGHGSSACGGGGGHNSSWLEELRGTAEAGEDAELAFPFTRGKGNAHSTHPLLPQFESCLVSAQLTCLHRRKRHCAEDIRSGASHPTRGEAYHDANRADGVGCAGGGVAVEAQVFTGIDFSTGSPAGPSTQPGNQKSGQAEHYNPAAIFCASPTEPRFFDSPDDRFQEAAHPDAIGGPPLCLRHSPSFLQEYQEGQEQQNRQCQQRQEQEQEWPQRSPQSPIPRRLGMGMRLRPEVIPVHSQNSKTACSVTNYVSGVACQRPEVRAMGSRAPAELEPRRMDRQNCRTVENQSYSGGLLAATWLDAPYETPCCDIGGAPRAPSGDAETPTAPLRGIWPFNAPDSPETKVVLASAQQEMLPYQQYSSYLEQDLSSEGQPFACASVPGAYCPYYSAVVPAASAVPRPPTAGSLPIDQRMLSPLSCFPGNPLAKPLEAASVPCAPSNILPDWQVSHHWERADQAPSHSAYLPATATTAAAAYGSKYAPRMLGQSRHPLWHASGADLRDYGNSSGDGGGVSGAGWGGGAVVIRDRGMLANDSMSRWDAYLQQLRASCGESGQCQRALALFPGLGSHAHALPQPPGVRVGSASEPWHCFLD